jgi:flavin-dependent dehydrogenase
MTRDSKLGFDTALSLFPELAQRLMGAAHTTSVRGALSVQRSLRAVTNDKFVLIGDASGSVDALAGRGLCLSFQQAECLAEALANNNLALYQEGHRRIRRVSSFIARLMLVMDRIPSVQRIVLRLFERYPAAFSSFLTTHLGTTTDASDVSNIADNFLEASEACEYEVAAEIT